MSELNAAVRRIMVLMTMADRRIVTTEIQMMSDVYERLFGAPLSRAEIDAEMDHIQRERPALNDFLDESARIFDEGERSTILKAAACISIADHSLHRDEKILLIRVGSRLGLSPDRISGLLREFTES